MDYKEKVIALLNSQELSKEQKEKLENIFPELKESEGEKIRQSIIAILDNYIDDDNTIKPAIMNWLEKQGEQMQTWEPSAAQLIVIKDLIEDKNTSRVNKVILRGMLEELEKLKEL